MSQRIIIATDESIVCPECKYHFPLQQGIARQIIEHYESEFEEALAARNREVEERAIRDAERNANDRFNALVAKVQNDAKAQALKDFEFEQRALAEVLVDKEAQLRELREREIDLRKKKAALEDAQENLQLDLQRRLDEGREKLQLQVRQRECERFALVEAEYKKKIEDAQKANEDLRRKLEQGSSQLRGEVLELELERTLSDAFVHDRIEEVKKGQRGADVLQLVCTSSGDLSGKIIWESKRSENWSDKWLQKLKDDQQQTGAEIAVLVTTSMPRGCSAPFLRIGDVWAVTPAVVLPLAETLRVILLEAHKIQLVNNGRHDKKEMLYDYVASSQFAQRVRNMLETFASMQAELEAEKRALHKIWSKRQTQVERLTGCMVGVVGELQGIAQDALPQFDAIERLALPLQETKPNGDAQKP